MLVGVTKSMAVMFELMAQVLVAAAAVGIAAFGLRFFAVRLQNALLEPQKKSSAEIYDIYYISLDKI